MGRYQLVDRVGSGAMGDVYRAKDLSTGSTVAIKTMKPALVRHDRTLLERFQREGEALRKLNHPNIIRLLDVISEDGTDYLVMEYVLGGDLAGLLANSSQPMPTDRVVAIALEIADALTRAHHLGIIHRDLKPANVLIAADGTPRVSDFGTALFTRRSRLTGINAIIGTMDYLAPEAISGEDIDARADVWSFGVMVFEMLAGQRPFRGDQIAALLAAILNEPTPNLETIRPDCPVGLVDLVYRMLAKDPMSRIPGMRHVGAALEDVLHDRPRRGGISRFATPIPDRLQPPTSNLPVQTTPFVGHAAELETLAKLLGDENRRLITILGPGGIGKTRLSMEVGAQAVELFRDGVFFADLTKIQDPALISTVIGESAEFPFSAEGTPREQILNFLSNKHMLLILDNYEHLLAGRDLAETILEAAPEVTVLVTSRERLHLVSETVFALDPLDFPDWETPEDALDYSAVQLFLQSARRVRANFELQPDDLRFLARICRLVEGMPLGILLAAGWIDTLSLKEIADEIRQSVDFLEAGATHAPDRQRSMRAVFEQSWKLLDPEERSSFSRMSVFRGGFSRAAAQAVSGVSLRMLTALVNKSLLKRDPGSGRFHIHELLRQFGAEYLDASGASPAIRAAHSSYYLSMLAEREADLKGRDQVQALDDIESDFENIRAAWLHAVDDENFELLRNALVPLALCCRMRGRVADGEDLLGGIRDRLAGKAEDEARSLWAWAITHRELLEPVNRRFDHGQADFEAALEVARQTDDPALEGFALYALALLHLSAFRHSQALEFFEKSLLLREQLGDQYYLAETLHYTAFCFEGSDWQKTVELSQQAGSIRRDIGDIFGHAISLLNLAWYVLNTGDRKAEMQYQEEALHLARLGKSVITICTTLRALQWNYLLKNRVQEAREAAAEAMAIAIRINTATGTADALLARAAIMMLDEDYDQLEEICQGLLALNVTDDILASAFFFLVAAAIGRNDFDEAEEQLWHLVSLTRSLPGQHRLPTLFRKSYLLARQKEFNRAAELLGLFFSQLWVPDPAEMPFPLDRRFLKDLKTALGEEEFAAAWARGEAMDPTEEFEKEFADWLHDANY